MAELSVMDRINMILSDPEKATMTLAQIVSEEIREFKASPEYAIMLEAESYYRNRSDVQRKTVDVANRSNTKIEHPILKKLVDQKANYLLSKPWTVDTKNSAYGEALTKATGIYGTVRVPAAKIDTSALTLDVAHINERRHGVTQEEAVSYIKNAAFSLKRRHWTGETFLNYYSEEGASYVRTSDNVIRTSFKKDEFDEKTKSAMEVLKNGK